MFYKGYIINADTYLLPYYKLSPFLNTDISVNKLLPNSNTCDDFFTKKHKFSFYYTYNGRSALNEALSNLFLDSTDVVTILTTTKNFYISSCVTTEIEKFCKWDREITLNTKVILLNHEFGFPIEKLQQLKELNIPIIEDCAYSFNSDNSDSTLGKIGDFVIYSFPKFFPVQIGGLLVSKKELTVKNTISYQEKTYICNVISYYLNDIDEISKIRRFNYNYLKNAIEKLGLQSRFEELNNKIVPGTFMFRLPDYINVQLLKQFFYSNGVECSVFYGENSFFIPCHHKLLTKDLDYFITLIDFFINKK
ncbi:MAG: DegT/DnrJ/EryC1/StrS aminotransferase family protein [Rickettsiales bacterium]|nr:MAG: DegT/DnrJ/EryC1/StrS aminotransferase family protein [Rickettsiales bacterium]